MPVVNGTAAPASRTINLRGYGFRACAIQVGCCRLGQSYLLNSGKPEFSRRIPEMTVASLALAVTKPGHDEF
jgi:hypothetical protein